jgi:hypothetical protein
LTELLIYDLIFFECRRLLALPNLALQTTIILSMRSGQKDLKTFYFA